MGSAVDVAQEAAGFSAGSAGVGIDLDVAHEREVEHQPGTDGKTGDVMTPTLDGKGNAMFAGDVDAGDHAGGIKAACDEGGAGVDPRIPDSASLLIGGVAGQ